LAELKRNSQENSEKYAIKRMNKKDVKERKLVENIKGERTILKESKSNFITRLHSVFRDEQYYYLTMEWARGGDLFTLIDKNSHNHLPFLRTGEAGVRFVLGCIILGLEDLHSRNIVFWDLKP
jgi:serine/threonine protein kinase